MGLLGALSLQVACLERTTGESGSLDPRFTALPDPSSSQPDAPEHPPSPFEDYEGETVEISGEVISPLQIGVDLDVRGASPENPDVRVNLGKIQLAAPGEWSFRAPVGHGALSIEAFQDLAGDGPGGSDPYAIVSLEIGDVDVGAIALELKEGAFEIGGAASSLKPFSDYEGETVEIAGYIISDNEEFPVDVDLRQIDLGVEGGMIGHGKLALAGPEDWVLDVPQDQGRILFQAFQDLTGDGPSDDDPFGFAWIEVTDADISDVELALTVGGKTALAAEMGHGGGGGGGGSAGLNFDAPEDAEMISVQGRIEGGEGPVDLDVRVVDSGAEGGNRQLGKLILAETGDFSFQVPSDYGVLLLEAFQDLKSDGPSDDDPFGAAQVEIGTTDISDVDIVLVIGARGSPGSTSEQIPFADHEGPWVTVRGTLESEAEGQISIDMRVPDATAQGGNRRLGTIHLATTGAYTFRVPADVGELLLEIFQDLNADGPSDDDPFASASVLIGDADTELDLQLRVGARGQPLGPSGGGGSGAGCATSEVFDDQDDMVSVSGTISLADGVEAESLDVDIATADPAAPGGRKQLGKLKCPPGDFTLQVPARFGMFYIEVLVDRDNDGPNPGDPFGMPEEDIQIGRSDITGVQILVSPTQALSQDL